MKSTARISARPWTFIASGCALTGVAFFIPDAIGSFLGVPAMEKYFLFTLAFFCSCLLLIAYGFGLLAVQRPLAFSVVSGLTLFGTGLLGFYNDCAEPYRHMLFCLGLNLISGGVVMVVVAMIRAMRRMRHST